MAVVLQVAGANGQVHRVRLEEVPTHDSVDRLIRGLWPGSGAARAKYMDEEGDTCQLNPATFSDFLVTARIPNGDTCPVLRLEMQAPAMPGKSARAGAACKDREAFVGTSDGETSGSWQVVEAAVAGRSEASEPDPCDVGAWTDLAKAGEPENSERSFEAVPMDVMELRTDDWSSTDDQAPDEDGGPPARPRRSGGIAGGVPCHAEGLQDPPPPPPAAPGRAQRAFAKRRRAKACAKADPNAVVHMAHVCDGCEACPLPGAFFHCRICQDYDLCESCFQQRRSLHNAEHRFQRVMWSKEVAPACPRGCGFGVTFLPHGTCCCRPCAEGSGEHSAQCLRANVHGKDLSDGDDV